MSATRRRYEVIKAYDDKQPGDVVDAETLTELDEWYLLQIGAVRPIDAKSEAPRARTKSKKSEG